MRVAVLGGGLSGLTAAWYLQRSLGRNGSVTVFEKADKPGGWAQTLREPFHFEKGPRSFRITEETRTALELIAALGLADELLPASDAARQRYLWDGRQLQRVPSSFVGAVRAPLTRDLLLALARGLLLRRHCGSDASVYRFISQIFSSEVAARLIDPLMSGIYAGDIHELSAECCLAPLWRWTHGETPFWRRRRRPLLPLSDRIGSSLFTLRGGLRALIDALACALPDLRLGCGVIALDTHPGGMKLFLEDGTTLVVDTIVSAVPPKQLERLLTGALASLTPTLAHFKATTVHAVHLGWRRSVALPAGFGYLIASRLGDEVLGAIFDSEAFPEQNKGEEETRLTVMMGGSHCPDAALWEQNECLRRALRAIKRHLAIETPPDFTAVSSAVEAIPQYLVGHKGKVQAFRSAAYQLAPHLFFIGNGFDGVSLSASIASAKVCAEAIAEPLLLKLNAPPTMCI